MEASKDRARTEKERHRAQGKIVDVADLSIPAVPEPGNPESNINRYAEAKKKKSKEKS